ncbi:MAG: family 10 glycosylhydrolase [Phycisphaeraceae bacterium]|nr:family 10 glycosylhydrolase [Phycisphaeraceae bacterium]
MALPNVLWAAEQVKLDIAINPIQPLSSNVGGLTEIHFADYVSNPQPGQSEPATGRVAQYKSPFLGILKPDAANTTRTPLPPTRGLVLESEGSVIDFHDLTSRAVCSNVIVRGNLTLRFVESDNPQATAGVSDLSLTLVGAALSAEQVYITIFDANNQQLGQSMVRQGDNKKYRADVHLSARTQQQPVAAIHRVVIENRDPKVSVFLGAGMDSDEPDLVFAGFAPTGSEVQPAPAAAPDGSHQARWSQYADSKLITDLRQVTPQEVLSDRRQRGKWKVFDYETPSFSGYALSACVESTTPPTRLALDVQGWYAVYLGLATINNFGKPLPNEIKARLSGDDAFSYFQNHLQFTNDGTTRRDRIEEIYMTTADLTGQDLILQSVINQNALLTYVRLVPLTEAEVTRVQAEQANRKNTRNLIACFDGHSMIWPYHPRTRQDIANTFASYRESDFGTWWFQYIGADLVNYDSDYGTLLSQGTEAFTRPVDRVVQESLQALVDNGVNVVQVAIDEAHKQDADILIFSRIGGWKGAHPWEETFSSRFYEANPQWRTVDRDGTPVMYMSYAYPEVQAQVIKVLREAVSMGADGAGIFFHRGMPMMLWEQGFLDRFAERYPGVDARQIPEDDPRIYAMRAEIVTEYLRNMRTMLDEVARERGGNKRLKLAVSTFATEADNQKFGLDIERWAKEGLVDQVGLAWFAYHTSGLAARKSDVAYYTTALKGTNTKVFPFVIGWQMSKPETLLNTATEMYQQGADGIVVWDSDPVKGWSDAEGSYWPMLRDLGHRDKLTDGSLLYKLVNIPLTRLGENYYSRWQPNTGF